MKKFSDAVAEFGVIEKKPEFEGRSLTMILTPKAEKAEK
jgi:translation initiation factor IF-3